ncbi:metalloregulator ArsR/SmtB family transcription factor [Rhizobium sp. SIMBA_035]
MDELPFLDERVALLGAIASPNRYRILKLLCDRESDVATLLAELRVPQSTMSRDLSVLRMHGIVSLRKEATRHFYSCRHDGVKEIMKILDEVLP